MINKQGQDQAAPTKVSEATLTQQLPTAVGNEESGQASPSSSTAIANHYHGNVDELQRNSESIIPVPSSFNLRTEASQNRAVTVANEAHRHASNELQLGNEENGSTDSENASPDQRPNVEVIVPGAGGDPPEDEDWFPFPYPAPGAPLTFLEFLQQIGVAAVIALALILFSEILDGLFRHPGGWRREKRKYPRPKIRNMTQ